MVGVIYILMGIYFFYTFSIVSTQSSHQARQKIENDPFFNHLSKKFSQHFFMAFYTTNEKIEFNQVNYTLIGIMP